MTKIAILLTVYNRKETTIKSLCLLHKIIQRYDDFKFDIFMVDDGCTDGTTEAVKSKFPKIYIYKGDGHLYWSGGMLKAWEIAIATDNYDYFIWFNDDAMLFDNAIDELFHPIEELGNEIIVSGAFIDDTGKASYGGRDIKREFLIPNGTLQDVYYMNGNWVLIPRQVVEKIGLIDNVYTHSFGDWDYGYRARKAGIKVCLAKKYVGKTNRHDYTPVPFNALFPFPKRIKYFFNSKYNPYFQYVFVKRHLSVIKAVRGYFFSFLYVFCPFIYRMKNIYTHKTFISKKTIE